MAVAAECNVEVPPFTVLRDEMRAAAEGWFGHWDVPNAEGSDQLTAETPRA